MSYQYQVYKTIVCFTLVSIVVYNDIEFLIRRNKPSCYFIMVDIKSSCRHFDLNPFFFSY